MRKKIILTGTALLAVIIILGVLVQTETISLNNKIASKTPGTTNPTNDPGITPPTPPNFENPIKITNQNVQLVTQKPEQKDWYQIKSAELDGETLKLEVRYDKSCAENTFSAYSTAKQGFMESNPVQTNLYFVHDARSDICMSDGVTQDQKTGTPSQAQESPTTTVEFSIQEIIDAHKKAYGTEGPITLNLRGFTNEQSTSLTYTP